VADEFYPRIYVTRRRRIRIVRGVWLVFLLLAAISVTAWFSREALLRGASELWIVSDSVGPADAVVIFGGNLEVRPFAAAEYYHQGLTKKILLSSGGLDRSETRGGLPSHPELNRTVLMKLGVSEMAIETFGNTLSNTYDEAVALREWIVRTGARSVIVPTEIFSSRRVRWIVGRQLAGSGTHVQVPALDDPAYRRAEWWKNEKGVIAFQNEVIKYIYYRLKY
jgi:uncharacterized SAM-binding protein YcdF (DUF218 family)